MFKNRYSELHQISRSVLKKCSCTSFPLAPFDLLNALNIPYCAYSDLPASKQHLYEELKAKPAITVVTNGQRAIFYNDLPARDYAIFHEIAHILLQHEEDNPRNEEEANTLASMLMCPPLPQTRKKTLKMAASILALAISFTIGLFCGPSALNPEMQESSPGVYVETEKTADDIVYITEHGTKYHKEGCRYLKNKDYKGFTASAAISEGYLPCKVCFKD